MARLDDATLVKLAEVLEEAARVCHRAQAWYDARRFRRTLRSTHHFLGIVLDVLEEQGAYLDERALRFLAGLAKTLAAQADADFVVADLMRQINAFLHTEAISLFVLQPADTLLLKYAAGPVGQAVVGLQFALGQGVVGWVARNNEALMVHSTDLDPRFFSGVDESTGFTTRSILGVPVTRAGTVVGVIEVLNKIGGDFGEQDVALLEAVAHLTAHYVFVAE